MRVNDIPIKLWKETLSSNRNVSPDTLRQMVEVLIADHETLTSQVEEYELQRQAVLTRMDKLEPRVSRLILDFGHLRERAQAVVDTTVDATEADDWAEVSSVALGDLSNMLVELNGKLPAVGSQDATR